MSKDMFFSSAPMGGEKCKMGALLFAYAQKRRNFLLSLMMGFCIFTLAFFWLAMPVDVFAQGAEPLDLGLEAVEDTGLVATDIRVIIARVIKTLLGLLGIVALSIVLWGGFRWMTAGGDADKVEKAKKILINGTIGIAIILSAYAITHFVFKALGVATGLRMPGKGGSEVVEQISFGQYAGASHLGKVIQDHYPGRGAKNISRNTQIIITFREPMDMSTMVLDAAEAGGNGNGVFGDCVDGVCDKINAENVLVMRSDETEVEGAQLREISAVVTGEGRTVTYIPTNFIGEPNEQVKYTVKLTGAIKRVNGDDAFGGLVASYEWEFTTSGEADETPPHVVRVSPVGEGGPDRLVQITFSEAMSPIGLDVSTAPDVNHFIRVVAEDGNEVLGRFRAVNGYKTATFLPEMVCGQNACGDEKRCLPFNASLTVLLETAELLQDGRPTGMPGTGLTDTSGNALDGGGGGEDGRAYNGESEGKPPLATPYLPDNYWWDLTTTDQIDLTSPTILNLVPSATPEGGGVQGDVDPTSNVSIGFSEEMSYATLTDWVTLAVEENAPPMGFITRMDEIPLVEDQERPTKTALVAIPVLPLTDRTFYAPHVPYKVQDATQNCYYPAIGPGCPELDSANPSCCSYRQDLQGMTAAPRTGCGDNLSEE